MGFSWAGTDCAGEWVLQYKKDILKGCDRKTHPLKSSLKKWGKSASRPGLRSFPDWAWLVENGVFLCPSCWLSPGVAVWSRGACTGNEVWIGEWGNNSIHWQQHSTQEDTVLSLIFPDPMACRCPCCGLTCLRVQERTRLIGWRHPCVEKSAPIPSALILNFM